MSNKTLQELEQSYIKMGEDIERLKEQEAKKKFKVPHKRLPCCAGRSTEYVI